MGPHGKRLGRDVSLKKHVGACSLLFDTQIPKQGCWFPSPHTPCHDVLTQT